MHRFWRLPRSWRLGALLLAACGRAHPAATPAPVPDTERTIDSLWKAGEREFDHGHWGRAQAIYQKLAPALSATDLRYLRLHYFLGETMLAQGDHLQAVREFRRVADEEPDGPLAADALVRAGDAYAELWRLPELDPTYGTTARTVYEEVLNRYPGTPAAGRATLRLKALNDKFATKEYKNALFYYRFKAWDSAILMLRSVIATYPQSSVVPDALERLVKAYQVLQYQEDVKETCAYIAQYHPDPAGPIRLCPKPQSSGPGSANPDRSRGRREQP